MKAARFALPLAVLLIGAAPAPATKTLYFARPYDPFRWCGYVSKAEQEKALESSHGGEAVRATYVAGRISRLVYDVSPESGDWVVTDEYVVSGGMVRVERRIGMANTEVDVVKRGAARVGQPMRLKLISARWADGRSAKTNGWYDPPVAVTSNVETFAFAPIGRTMLRRGLSKLCQ